MRQKWDMFNVTGILLQGKASHALTIWFDFNRTKAEFALLFLALGSLWSIWLPLDRNQIVNPEDRSDSIIPHYLGKVLRSGRGGELWLRVHGAELLDRGLNQTLIVLSRCKTSRILGLKIVLKLQKYAEAFSRCQKELNICLFSHGPGARPHCDGEMSGAFCCPAPFRFRNVCYVSPSDSAALTVMKNVHNRKRAGAVPEAPMCFHFHPLEAALETRMCGQEHFWNKRIRGNVTTWVFLLLWKERVESFRLCY